MDYAAHLAFRSALERAPHLAGLKSTCKAFCAALGVDYFLFCVCEAVSLTSPRIVRLTNFPEAWLDTVAQRGVAADPLLDYCFTHTAPTLWGEPAGLRAFREAARTFGLQHGLTVPVNAPGGQTAFFSLASGDAGFDEHRLGNLLPAAGMFGNYLFDAYVRIDRIENPKVANLTERELECVFWACEGKTAWEMAQIVGVAERTVNFHLTSVIKKLGASSRQHAVAKAVLYGLVKPRA